MASVNKSPITYRLFYDKNSHLYARTHKILGLLIVISIISITLESVPQLSRYHDFFVAIEYVAVGIFTLEYVMRVIGSRKKFTYIFSFLGIIDLLSIIPTWLHAANLTPLKSIRMLRILRFLRILRLAKITRINHLKKPSPEDSKQIIKINLWIYFFSLLFIVIVLGNLAYIFEHGNPHFESIPLSMLWILESLLGGSISSTIPQTYPGIFVFIIARFSSYVLLGFMIHIVGKIISHILFGRNAGNNV